MSLPTPPQRADGPELFADRGDIFLAALPAFETKLEAIEVNVVAKEASAAASAGIATTQAGLATTNGAAQVALATTQAGIATTQAGLATTNGAAQVALATTQAGIATTKANETTASAAAAAASAATAAGIAAFVDTSPVVKGSLDATKQARFEVDGLTTGTTRVLTVPDKDGTMAMLSDLPSGGDATKNVGYLNVPQNSQSVAYTCVLTDAGKHIYHPSADTTARIFTIPANASVAYPVGTALTFINDTSAGVVTIAITTDVLVWAGVGSLGSRTLAANGMATAVKITATRWMISGAGLT